MNPCYLLFFKKSCDSKLSDDLTSLCICNIFIAHFSFSGVVNLLVPLRHIIKYNTCLQCVLEGGTSCQSTNLNLLVLPKFSKLLQILIKIDKLQVINIREYREKGNGNKFTLCLQSSSLPVSTHIPSTILRCRILVSQVLSGKALILEGSRAVSVRGSPGRQLQPTLYRAWLSPTAEGRHLEGNRFQKGHRQ